MLMWDHLAIDSSLAATQEEMCRGVALSLTLYSCSPVLITFAAVPDSHFLSGSTQEVGVQVWPHHVCRGFQIFGKKGIYLPDRKRISFHCQVIAVLSALLSLQLTYGLTEKELKRKGNNLLFTNSVKTKVKEYIRQYMKKVGTVYRRADSP